MEAKGMEMILLKNGFKEPDKLVKVITLSLQSLMRDLPIVFLDFVEFCQDSQCQIDKKKKEVLKKRGLLEDNGAIHDSIKNIVLSSVKGEGMDMRLTNPIAS
jgi:hypothetical protein